MMAYITEAQALEFSRLHLCNSEVDFLVGAGLSMRSPSLLPSGMELKQRVVSLALERLPSKTMVSEMLNDHAFAAIQPEVLFGDIFSVSARFLFLAIRHELTGVEPNRSHQTIGCITRRNNSKIYTTNFDKLLQCAGVNESQISHLHGSISEPNKMAILISDINREFQILESHTNRKILIISGYSGNDPDVLKFLQSSLYETIIWLTKLDRDEPLETRVTQAKLKAEIYFCQTDMHNFIESLSSENSDICLRKFPNRAIRPTAPDVGRATIIAALLFFRIGQFARSVELIDGYLMSSSPKSRSLILRAELLRDDAGKAIGISSEETLARLQPLRGTTYNLRIELINKMGVLYLETRQFTKAKRQFHKIIKKIESRKLAINNRDRIIQIYALVVNNLGLCYYEMGDFKNAEINFLKSIKLKRRLGNQVGLINSLHNIALVYAADGNFRRSKIWSIKALNIVNRFGVYRRRIEHLIDMFDIFIYKNYRSKARVCLDEAVFLYHSHASHLASLGVKLDTRKLEIGMLAH